MAFRKKLAKTRSGRRAGLDELDRYLAVIESGIDRGVDVVEWWGVRAISLGLPS